MKNKQTPSAISVIIPARDENAGIEFLTSLVDTSFTIHVDLYVVINAAENDPNQIKQSNLCLYDQINQVKLNLPSNYFLHSILENQLNIKDSGVGLARKIGMDLAAQHHADNKEIGILICFDADCLAPMGYLKAIFNEFLEGGLELASIKYKHQINHEQHPIIDYELFLRYYSEALKRAGYPFWFQTVGSSMAVLSNHYVKHGGMNKRKAGEDFYFMHKMMPVCKIGQVNSTCNVLSARDSERVPFGTGKAMIEANVARLKGYYSYQPVIFDELKVFLAYFNKITKLEEVDQCQQILSLNKVAIHFEINCYWDEIIKIKNNCKDIQQFKPRFFQFFNGFKVLKYVHWARDTYYSNIILNEAVNEFLNINSKQTNNLDLLMEFRALEN